MPVHVSVHGGVATLRLDRPPLNVLDRALIDETDQVVQALESDAQVHWLVVCGEGRAFSAGVDILDHLPERIGPTLATFHRLIRRLIEGRLLSVAFIDGHALGGGLELALACDFIVATERSTLSQPEIDVGCYPPVSVLLLPALLGEKRALDMLLLGRRLTASEALAWGLINRIDATVDDLLRQLKAKSPAVCRLARREIRYRTLARLDAVEARYKSDLVPLPDCLEGVQAFLEKRPPVWKI